MQLFCGNGLILFDLAFMICWVGPEQCNLGQIIPYYSGKLTTQWPWLVRTGIITRCLWAPDNVCSLLIPSYVFLQPPFPHIYVLISTEFNYQRGSSADLWSSVFSSHRYSVLWTLATLVSLVSQLHFSLMMSTRLFLNSSLPHGLETPSRQ